MKLLKKLPKILLIFLVLIVIALIAIPYFFKDELVVMAKEEANNYLNAKVDFGDFGLSLFSNFPNFTFSVEDLTVDGVDAFEGVRLAEVGSVDFELNLASVIGLGSININRLHLTDPTFHILVNSDTLANYDIVKADSTDVAEEPEIDEPEESSGSYSFRLKEYSVSNLNLVYDDVPGDMFVEIKDLDHEGEGDFTLDNFMLETVTTIEEMNVEMEGVHYLKKSYADLKADFEMNLPNMKFTFNENELQLNELFLNFDGYFAMPEEGYEMDLSFEALRTSFKSILSLVPAVFLTDFEDIEFGGNVGLNGQLKGLYSDHTFPAFDVTLNVDNGMFHYPDMPKSAENIFVNTRVQGNGDPSMDDITVNVSKFHVELAENPIDVKLTLSQSMSVQKMDCDIKAQLDLASIKEVIPLEEGEEYNGNITADVALHGNIADVMEEKYDDFNATGQLILSDMLYRSPELDYDVNIDKSEFNFSPEYLELSSFDCRIGKSDISANGKIDNYLAYIMNDEKLHGTFNVNSQYFDLNELMGETDETASTETEENTSETEEELSVIEIPGNVDFSLNSSFGKLLYDNIEMTDVAGGIILREKVATLNKLKMKVLDGNVTLNGKYLTLNPKKPEVNFDMDVRNLDIKKTAQTFNTVDKLAPIAKKCNGLFSTTMKLNTALDEKMEPVYSTMNGGGKLQTSAVTIDNFKPLQKLGDVLKMPELSRQELKNINLAYTFKDGLVEVKPFDVKIGNINSRVAGTTSFEQEINYTVDMKVPSRALGGTANDLANNLLSQLPISGATLPKEINVVAKITGTVEDPKVVPTFKGLGKGETVKEQIKETVKQEIEEAKEEVKEKVNEKAKEEAEKILAQAQQQADKLVAEAKKAADKVRAEGNAAAKKIEDEAKNPFAKAAAKIAADKVRKETEKKAQKIEDEAQKKADDIMAKAKKQADEKLKL